MIGLKDFFFCGRFNSFHTHAFLLTFFCFFVLFHSCCSYVRVFGRTLAHEFHLSYAHTEWYLRFSDSATTRAQCVFEAKSKNTFALVNLCLPLNQTTHLGRRGREKWENLPNFLLEVEISIGIHYSLISKQYPHFMPSIFYSFIIICHFSNI